MLDFTDMTEEQIRGAEHTLVQIFRLANELGRWPTQKELMEFTGYYDFDEDDPDNDKVLSLTDEAFQYLIDKGLIILDKSKMN